jgi:hypothetical protein
MIRKVISGGQTGADQAGLPQCPDVALCAAAARVTRYFQGAADQMTVRTWFRMQRATLWQQHNGTFHDLDAFTEKVIRVQEIDPIETVWPYKIIFTGSEAYIRRTKLIEDLQAKLRQAMWDMERECQRRSALEHRAKDLLG